MPYIYVNISPRDLIFLIYSGAFFFNASCQCLRAAEWISAEIMLLTRIFKIAVQIDSWWSVVLTEIYRGFSQYPGEKLDTNPILNIRKQHQAKSVIFVLNESSVDVVL
jgi:hypothetical protein